MRRMWNVVRGILEEFKTFVMRGNVLDMAVGIIIGAAFGKIVTSFVNDVLMPPIGMLLGRVDFSDLFINLSSQPVASLAEAKAQGIPVKAYGAFLNNIIAFLIVAAAVFILVREVNRLVPKKKEKAPHLCPFCKEEIPDGATRCPHCTSELPADS